VKEPKRARSRLRQDGKRRRLRAGYGVGPDAVARRWFDAVDAAKHAAWHLDNGSASEAAVAAARAVSLAPREPRFAHLYAEAAARSADRGHLRNAYEHLLHFIEPEATFLITLAGIHEQAKDYARAAKLAEQARGRFPERLKKRRQWMLTLELIEERCAAAREREKSERGGARLRGRDPSPASARPTMGRPGAAPSVTTASSPPPAAVANPAAPTARAVRAGDNEAAGVQQQPKARPATLPQPPAPATTEERDHPSFTIPIAIAEAIDGLEVLEQPELAEPMQAELAVLAARIRETESFDRLLSVEHARGLEPLSYQQETVRRALSGLRGRALLADEVGLGKTIEAGLILSEYLLRGHVRAALVLTPPSLVGQWREELAAKFGITARTTQDAAFRKDPDGFWSQPGVVIASLATARSMRNHELVAARAWDIVIIDEAHTLKNARTKAYELAVRLRSRFLLLLTATPIENDVEELYNLVGLIRAGHLGGRREFVRRFGRDGRRVTEGVRSTVRELLGEVMVRNTRALSGIRLPPRFARTVLVEPEEDERALYEHLVRALRVLGVTGRARALISLLLQEAGSSPFAVRSTLEKLRTSADLTSDAAAALAPAIAFAGDARRTAKGRALVAALDGLTEPALVFTRFRATLDFIVMSLEHAGIPCERLDGQMPATARNEAIERCRRRSAVLVSTDVGSEGLNLQFCDRVVNYDLPWNPMRIEQRIGRLHRIGQQRAVDVINLCLAGSIEERILRILDERINLFELVVGEVEMILGYLDAETSFPDLMLSAFAEPDENRRAASFDTIGEALARARSRYHGVKAYDDALFRNELGV
jgi:superfamily II DNA or RNA helicase